MTVPSVPDQLREIAEKMPSTASFEDAMYELYVRRKVTVAREAAERGETFSHEEVKRRFQRCPK